MTCIVALRHNGTIYMAADSAGCNDHDMTIRADPKIFALGNMLFGFTTSFRFGQLLRYHLEIPTFEGIDDPHEYLVRRLVPAMRTVLKDGGYSKVENGVEQGATCMIGLDSGMYVIDSDFQVGESVDAFAAIGSGHAYAKGVLFALDGKALADPIYQLSKALHAAERFTPSVCGPFYAMTLDDGVARPFDGDMN